RKKRHRLRSRDRCNDSQGAAARATHCVPRPSPVPCECCTDEGGRMSTTVRNTTPKPLSVPLPRGKILHLGPLKSAEIASDDAEHAGVKALVESGTLEIVAIGPGHA